MESHAVENIKRPCETQVVDERIFDEEKDEYVVNKYLYIPTYNLGYIEEVWPLWGWSFPGKKQELRDNLDNLPTEQKISELYLYLNSLLRNIDLNLSCDEIVNKFLHSIPSVEWQKDNILEFLNSSKEEINTINNYEDWGYEYINEYFRKTETIDPNDVYYKIQKVILRMPKLSRDITVFRYMGEKDIKYLPTSPGDVVVLKGYTSTSFDALYTSDRVCNPYKIGEDKIVLKIQVPKGKQCLYLPTTESELLFPLDTKLRLDFINTDDIFACRGLEDEGEKELYYIKYGQITYNLTML